ncbi:MAG: phosphotransferase [Betaproteobacteria bacterium]|nr:phosphotransferase [Betaproteobacteria bacterium]MDE2622429.1 phosphotransferase [Betaproteobacteria bacterium]
MSRLNALHAWVSQTHPAPLDALTPASSDASFRRYFRLTLGEERWIVMDAPPDRENCRPFVAVAELFGAAGLHVPQVLRADFEQGFLLLTDLGDTTYLQALEACGGERAQADRLYRAALDALVTLQRASHPNVLPEYDAALLQRELDLFPEWYAARHLGHALEGAQRATFEAACRALLDNVLAQPRVYVHRDYHSRNLMVCDPLPGVLDFQDAVYGPITYDAVSLLRDAYVMWEEEQVIDWLVRYWERARAARLPVAADFGDFYRDFEWMGVQRQLKVLGIFARLNHRDGKAGYLADMPRVAQGLHAACSRYRELAPLAHLLETLWGTVPQVGYTF